MCTPAFAQTTLTPPKDPVSATYFGMHNHQPLDPKLRVSIDIGTYRLWDADVNWPNLEPSRDRWQWDRLDQIVALAQQRRWQLIVPLAFSPRWASARPNENTFSDNSRLGWAAEPANIDDWRVYVRTVVTRYKGRVAIYEVWNEPNSSVFFTGTIPQLINLVREAYAIVKEVDPAATMVSPSIVHGGGTGLQYLGNYLAQGGGAYADVIGYHFYIDTEPPEQLPVHIAEVQRVMSRNGVANKALWNTEATWAANEMTFPSMDLQAAYVSRSYILNWAGGVSQFDWYAWDNRIYPSIYMLEADFQTPTLAAIAYSEVRRWLLGSRMLSVSSDAAGNWTCALARPDGTAAYILWNPARSTAFPLPSNWHAVRVRNVAGTVQGIASAQVTIGISPVLIETSAAAYPVVKASAISAAALADGPVAPASLASVFAAGLNAGVESPDYLPWFETLGGATVLIQDSSGQTSLAQLSYAGPDQVNFLVPATAASGTASVTAVARDGNVYQTSIRISPVAPGIFTADSTGVGPIAAYVVTVDSSSNQTLTYTFTCAQSGQCQTNAVPASTNSRSSALVIFGTGIRGGGGAGAVSVSLCGTRFTPSYVGPHAIYPGLDQLNVPLPASLRGCGATALQLTVNGVASNAGVLLIQ